VEDAAEGILLATEHYHDSQPVNLGSSNELSIKELVEIISRVTGFEGRIVWDTTRPNGQPRRSLDTSRANGIFGFKAQVGFEEGLRQTIAWYVAQLQRSA
jgi:GDP-L-fucose synthase